MWSADKREKYGTPEKKVDQMLAYVKYFQDYHAPKKEPHIFYVDARWSSLALLDGVAKARCYGVLSCSAKMRPQGLMTWMRRDLEKGDWRSVGYPRAKANLITIRTKKKVYLNLLTNYASLASVPMKKRRRKAPANTYSVRAPFAQKNYSGEWQCDCGRLARALAANLAAGRQRTGVGGGRAAVGRR